ncbi:MAG: GIY-YIG nuclease family protein [Alphaproteobacteria bacterium]
MEERLIASGFALSARWKLQAKSRVQLIGEPPKQPGVYAFAVDGEVCYVGSARLGIAKRLRPYEITKDKTRPAFRIRTLIRKALKSGSEVTVLTIVNLKPIQQRGLPVDLIAGIEVGLIRKLQPKWNRRERGALRKQKGSEISN